MRPSKPFDVLNTPVAVREWLSLGEAIEFTGRSVETIKKWRRFGLLPSSLSRATVTAVSVLEDPEPEDEAEDDPA